MRVAIDITLWGTQLDPLPIALHNELRRAFEEEVLVNLLALPEARIVSFSHSSSLGEWSVTLHAEGRSTL